MPNPDYPAIAARRRPSKSEPLLQRGVGQPTDAVSRPRIRDLANAAIYFSKSMNAAFRGSVWNESAVTK